MGCLLAVFLPLAALAAFIFAAEQRDDRLDEDSRRVPLGMAHLEVEAIMGTPSWKGRCNSLGAPLERCASELGYSSWLAPLKPVYWIIQLDSGGRVIAVDLLASP